MDACGCRNRRRIQDLAASGRDLLRAYYLHGAPLRPPMEIHEAPLIAAALEHLVRSGAPAAQIAGSVASTWRHVEESLTPILGPQGVAALYKRSLVLTSRSHPWLAPLVEAVPGTVDLAALTAAMTEQESNDAARAGGELLQTFYGLVNNVIGTSLTHRLLRFMWQTF